MNNTNTEIIDISKYTRKLYLIWTFVGIGVLAIFSVVFKPNEIVVFSLMLFMIVILLYGVDYFIHKDKVVLSLGNMLMDKHNDYRLTKSSKTIDKLRIRVELNLEEDKIMKKFKEFLEKNELSKYEKVYLVGSNSPDNVQMVSDIVNHK